MKSVLPALVVGLVLAVLVFTARCSQRAMRDYELRASSTERVDDTESVNSLPNELAESDRMASQFPDTLLSTTGMRFRILTPGSGPRPVAGNSVRFHYTARLLDGSVIASVEAPAESVKISLLKNETPRGLPAPIRGLDLSLLEMQPGEKRLVLMPSRLAFGAAGHPPLIPPRAPLVVEVELLPRA